MSTKRRKLATHSGIHWCDDEIEYLTEHYATTDNAVLARELGRSKQSVQHQARLRLLKKDPQFKSDSARQRMAIRAANRGGFKNAGYYLNELKRLQHGQAHPGCRTHAEVLCCELLRDKDGLTANQVVALTGLHRSTVQHTLKALSTLYRKNGTRSIVTRIVPKGQRSAVYHLTLPSQTYTPKAPKKKAREAG